MDHHRQRYQAIRAALENLVADDPDGRPSAAYLAACSSLNGHCEECGAPLTRTDTALPDALEPVRQSAAHVPSTNGCRSASGSAITCSSFLAWALGCFAAGAQRVTDGMCMAAARALHACSPARRDPTAALYPLLEDVREVSHRWRWPSGSRRSRTAWRRLCRLTC